MPFYKNIHTFQYKLVDLILKIYVSLFLIYRFNDFRTIKLTDLDRKIGFNAGVLLIGSDIVNYLALNYSQNIKNINLYISNFINNFLFFRN